MDILKMKTRLVVSFGLLSFTLVAGNLQLNGSFELGLGGYSSDRHLDPAKNPSLEYIQPELDDSLPNSGKYAVKLANPYGEYYVFYGKEFFLKKGETYQISCYARAGRDGCPLDFALAHYSLKHQRQGQNLLISAGTAWKKFSFHFTSPVDGAYFLQFTNNCQSGTVWLDNISVAPLNDSSSDAPEAVFKSAQKIYFSPQKEVAFSGSFKGKPGTELTVVAENDYDKNCYEIQKFRRNGEATETAEFTWVPPRYGAYRLKITDPDFRQADGYFAYLKPVEKVNFDLNTVMPGCNGGIVINGPYRFRTIGYEYSEITPREHAAILGKIGVRTLRLHCDGNSWAVLEPEDGKFDFSCLDTAHDLLAANGVQQLMTIASNDTFSKEIQGWTQKGFPDWLKEKDCTVKDKGSQWQYLVPEKYWRRYVRNIVRHFREKNYAPVFEIINEPQFYMTAEEYMTRFLIPASEEIRAEWKEAKIVGICSTSDYGAKIGPFAQGCLDMGVGKYIDAVSFHPYGSREINSSDPADKQIQSLKKLFVCQGKAIPLWENELYFLFDGPSMAEWYCAMRPQAHQIPIRYIIDIGEGCAQVMPIHVNQLWTRTLIPSIEGFQSNEGNLSAGAIAFSVMSDFLTGATPTATLRPFPGCAAYVFRDRGGGEIAALWLYQNTEAAALDLSGFQAWDMFGNRLPPGFHKPGNAPMWLRAKNGGNLAGLVKQVNVKFENPLCVSGITRYDGKRFLITVFNHGDSDVSGYVTGIGGEGLATGNAVGFSVKAKSSVPVSIPAVKDPKRTGKPEVSLYCNGKQNRFTTGFSRIGSARPGQKMRIGDNAEGEFRISGDKLTLTLRVKDATNSGADNRAELWNQDGVELFVEPNPDDFSNDAKCANYTDSTFRAFLSPRLPTEKQLTVWNMTNKELSAKDFSCRLVNTPEGYQATLEMPIEKLKLKNRLGLEIKVNDADAGNVSQAAWSSPEKVNEAWRDRSGFGLLEW